MSGQRPRVVLFFRDGLFARVFLRRFISTLNLDVVGFVLSSSYLQRGKHPLSDLASFIAKVGVSYALYQARVSCLAPFLCTGRPTIRTMIDQLAMPTHVTTDVNSEHSKIWLNDLNADFFLSFHFNQRFSPDVLSLPSTAALNFHPSLLPNYRGVDPVLFALADRQPSLGLSIHLLSDALDEGDILLQEHYPVSSLSLISNNIHLFDKGGALAAHVIDDFENYYAKREKQLCDGARYYGWDQVKNVSLRKMAWR